MPSLRNVIGVVLSGFLVSIGGQATAETQSLLTEIVQSPAGKTIEGQVLRVEGNNCVIKDQDGKEVRLQIDLPILKAENIEPGDRIEAQVNDRNHVLSFRLDGDGSLK
jgi:outer membrane lipoprotein SlyB